MNLVDVVGIVNVGMAESHQVRRKSACPQQVIRRKVTYRSERVFARGRRGLGLIAPGVRGPIEVGPSHRAIHQTDTGLPLAGLHGVSRSQFATCGDQALAVWGPIVVHYVWHDEPAERRSPACSAAGCRSSRGRPIVTLEYLAGLSGHPRPAVGAKIDEWQHLSHRTPIRLIDRDHPVKCGPGG